MFDKRNKMFFGTAWMLTRATLRLFAAAMIACLLLVLGIALFRDNMLAACAFVFLGAALNCWVLAAILKMRRDTRKTVATELRRRGFCTFCGYDLHASGARCPECGHIVPPERRACENVEV